MYPILYNKLWECRQPHTCRRVVSVDLRLGQLYRLRRLPFLVKKVIILVPSKRQGDYFFSREFTTNNMSVENININSIVLSIGITSFSPFPGDFLKPPLTPILSVDSKTYTSVTMIILQIRGSSIEIIVKWYNIHRI